MDAVLRVAAGPEAGRMNQPWGFASIDSFLPSSADLLRAHNTSEPARGTPLMEGCVAEGEVQQRSGTGWAVRLARIVVDSKGQITLPWMAPISVPPSPIGLLAATGTLDDADLQVGDFVRVFVASANADLSSIQVTLDPSRMNREQVDNETCFRLGRITGMQGLGAPTGKYNAAILQSLHSLPGGADSLAQTFGIAGPESLLLAAETAEMLARVVPDLRRMRQRQEEQLRIKVDERRRLEEEAMAAAAMTSGAQEEVEVQAEVHVEAETDQKKQKLVEKDAAKEEKNERVIVGLQCAVCEKDNHDIANCPMLICMRCGQWGHRETTFCRPAPAGPLAKSLEDWEKLLSAAPEETQQVWQFDNVATVPKASVPKRESIEPPPISPKERGPPARYEERPGVLHTCKTPHSLEACHLVCTYCNERGHKSTQCPTNTRSNHNSDRSRDGQQQQYSQPYRERPYRERERSRERQSFRRNDGKRRERDWSPDRRTGQSRSPDRRMGRSRSPDRGYDRNLGRSGSPGYYRGSYRSPDRDRDWDRDRDRDWDRDRDRRPSSREFSAERRYSPPHPSRSSYASPPHSSPVPAIANSTPNSGGQRPTLCAVYLKNGSCSQGDNCPNVHMAMADVLVTITGAK